jgi:hypothetical protein
VRKLRPGHAWPDVMAAVNVALPASHRRFTMDRLVSAVRLLVAEGLAERELLGTAPRRPSLDSCDPGRRPRTHVIPSAEPIWTPVIRVLPSRPQRRFELLCKRFWTLAIGPNEKSMGYRGYPLDSCEHTNKAY